MPKKNYEQNAILVNNELNKSYVTDIVKIRDKFICNNNMNSSGLISYAFEIELHCLINN